MIRTFVIKITFFIYISLVINVYGLCGHMVRVVWWQNGDLELGWVLEYIQRFIVDSGRWGPTDHKSD